MWQTVVRDTSGISEVTVYVTYKVDDTLPSVPPDVPNETVLPTSLDATAADVDSTTNVENRNESIHRAGSADACELVMVQGCDSVFDDELTPHFTRVERSVSTLRGILECLDPSVDRAYFQEVAREQVEEVENILAMMGRMCDNLLSKATEEVGVDIVGQCRAKWQDRFVFVVKAQNIMRDAG